MKKLMIAAACAALGVSAWAGCNLDEDADCAEVYDATFTIKTTECKLLYTPARHGQCGLGQAEICECYRDVVTLKINGILFYCFCSCSEDEDVGAIESTLQVAPLLWNRKTNADIEGNQLFWIATKKIALQNVMTFDHLYRIGKNNLKVEAAGTFGSLTFAGTGTYDANNNRVKQIAGNVAGLWQAAPDCADADEVCLAYTLCDEDQAAGVDQTVAFGSFTVTYNANKSKKLAIKQSYLKQFVPAAVFKYTSVAYYYGEGGGDEGDEGGEGGGEGGDEPVEP